MSDPQLTAPPSALEWRTLREFAGFLLPDTISLAQIIEIARTSPSLRWHIGEMRYVRILFPEGKAAIVMPKLSMSLLGGSMPDTFEPTVLAKRLRTHLVPKKDREHLERFLTELKLQTGPHENPDLAFSCVTWLAFESTDHFTRILDSVQRAPTHTLTPNDLIQIQPLTQAALSTAANPQLPAPVPFMPAVNTEMQ